MSEIRWCDEGQHPFTANDPRRQQYTNTMVNPINGVREVIDVCGPCVAIRSELSAKKLTASVEPIRDSAS